MKSWSMAKPLLVVGIAVVLVFAGNVEVQASGPVVQAKQAISSLGGKALNKVVAWSVIALLSTAAVPCNVLAQSCDTPQSIQQAVQTQAPIAAEHKLAIPLYDAVQRLNYAQLKELLEAGVVDVNAKDENGNTALNFPYLDSLVNPGSENFDMSKLELILAHGADPKIKNNGGRSIYDNFDESFDTLWGANEGDPIVWIDMIYIMVELFGINGKNNDGAPLLYALSWSDYSGEMGLVRELVTDGADVRLPEYDGSGGIHDPLEAAAALVKDREAFISLLFEQEEGIVTALDQQGENLLELADRWDNAVVIDVLRKYGVNNEAKNYTIPLYDALAQTSHSQLKELLEAGVVDVNARDEKGNTALYYPYVENFFGDEYFQELRLVLAHGADPRIKNNAGESPYYDYDYLWGGEPETAIIFTYFVEELFGINGKNNDGAPLGYALAWADYSGEMDLAHQLVAEGADVRLPEYHHGGSAGINSPIEAAAALVQDREAFVSLLFEQEEGVVNVLKQQGKHLIELADRWDNQVVVDVLRVYGFDITGKK